MASNTVYVFVDRKRYLQATTVAPSEDIACIRIEATKHGDLRVFDDEGDEIDPSNGRLLNT